MKFDKEQIPFEGNGNLMHDSVAFEHSNGTNAIGFRSGKGAGDKKPNDKFYDSKRRENDVDIFSYSTVDENNWTTSKYDIDDAVKDIIASVQFTHFSQERESFSNNRVVCMDNGMTQCEVPKEVVCYKESTCVKDICIDKGALSRDNYLVDSRVSKERACATVSPANDFEIETVKEKFDIDVPSADVIKEHCFTTQEGRDIENDSLPDYNSKNSIITMEVKDLESKNQENKPLKKSFSLRELLSMAQLDMGNVESRYSMPYKTSLHEVDQKTHQRHRESEHAVRASGHEDILISPGPSVVAELPCDHELEILESSFQDSASEHYGSDHEKVFAGSPISEANKFDDDHERTTMGKYNSDDVRKPASHGLDSISEESTSTTALELNYSSKVGPANITFNFDSSAPKANMRNNCLKNDSGDQLAAQNSFWGEDTDTAPVPRSSIGEYSFSAASPLKLITSSGSNAYSGSVSLRSDCSTTSTVSFAFPLLQSEWNSSPVRMAKADRRLRRKHKWRQRFVCCRF